MPFLRANEFSSGVSRRQKMHTNLTLAAKYFPVKEVSLTFSARGRLVFTGTEAKLYDLNFFIEGKLSSR